MAAAERAEGSAAVRDEEGHRVAHRERGDEPLRIEAEAEGGQRRVLPQQAWLGLGLGLGLGSLTRTRTLTLTLTLTLTQP